MRLPLARRELEGPWTTRAFDPSDVTQLATLLLPAYRGTVHDEGEDESDAVEEVERVMQGEYGPFMPVASFAVEDAGRIVGASMVTRSQTLPFLAHLVVHPDRQRRGIGEALIASSGNALLSGGEAELELMVIEANEPAVKLYRKLGFRVVDRLTEPPSST